MLVRLMKAAICTGRHSAGLTWGSGVVIWKQGRVEIYKVVMLF
jgi:hypothetical protein